MNPLEELTVIILTLFDHMMDLFTFGQWSHTRGNRKVTFKIKKAG